MVFSQTQNGTNCEETKNESKKQKTENWIERRRKNVFKITTKTIIDTMINWMDTEFIKNNCKEGANSLLFIIYYSFIFYA